MGKICCKNKKVSYNFIGIYVHVTVVYLRYIFVDKVTVCLLNVLQRTVLLHSELVL
jgi:hypothetical protein